MTLLKNNAGAGRVEAGSRKASEAVWEPGARQEEPGVPQRSPVLGFAGILSKSLSQHHLLGFEIDQLEFHHLH